MRVGIDFDNTIAGYDQRLRCRRATARGWVAPDFAASKRELRDCRAAARGRRDQVADAAGRGLRRAHGGSVPFPGRRSISCGAPRANLDRLIVSHKTRHSAYDPHRIDLRQAALRWLETQGFFDPAGFGLSARTRVLRGHPRAQDRAHRGARLRGLHRRPRRGVRPTRLSRRRSSASCSRPPTTDGCSERWFVCARAGTRSMGVSSDPCAAAMRAATRLRPSAERLAGAAVRCSCRRRAGGNNRLFRVETDAGDLRAQDLFPAGERPARSSGDGFNGARLPAPPRRDQVPRPIAADRRRRLCALRMDRGRAGGRPAPRAHRRRPRARPARSSACAAPPTRRASARLGSLPVRRRDLVARSSGARRRCGAPAPSTPSWPRSCGTLPPALQRRPRRRERAHARRPVALRCADRARAEAPQPLRFRLPQRPGAGETAVVFLDFEYFGWDDPVKVTSRLPPASRNGI